MVTWPVFVVFLTISRVYIYKYFFFFLSTIKAFRRSLKKTVTKWRGNSCYLVLIHFLFFSSFIGSCLPHESQISPQNPANFPSDKLFDQTWKRFWSILITIIITRIEHRTLMHTHTHLLKSICTCLVDDNLINHRSAIDNCTHFSQSPGLDEIKKKRQLARDLLSITRERGSF